jgi:hypothetical protein
VSLLSRAELQAVLTPSQVLMTDTGPALARLGRQRRPAIDAIAGCPGIEPGQPAWTGALAALAAQLHGMAGGSDKLRANLRANLRVILSNSFVRYAIVPWQAGLHGGAEDAAYVRHYFAQVFGSAADGWDVCVSAAPAGHPRLASAIDAALLAGLRDLCASARIRLKAVKPQLATTFNSYRNSVGESGWFVMAEPGCLCIGLFDRGRWLSVQTVRAGAAWQQELPALLERAACLAGPACAADQVFLWAPALAAGSSVAAGRFRIELLAPVPAVAGAWYQARSAWGTAA